MYLLFAALIIMYSIFHLWNLFFEVPFLFHFSIFAFQTSVPWLVAGVAVAGTFPRALRQEIGWNKTLLSIWLTWNTALKIIVSFLFWETRGEAQKLIATQCQTTCWFTSKKNPWQSPTSCLATEMDDWSWCIGNLLIHDAGHSLET